LPRFLIGSRAFAGQDAAKSGRQHDERQSDDRG
jgi:hypothetical protein